MGLLLLIPGLILLLVNASWFEGQHTVGVILTVIGSILLVAQIIWSVFIASKVRDVFNETRW